jgi:hypothetical protein
MDVVRIKEAFAMIKRGTNMLSGGPLTYYLETLTDCYDLLITRYAPFKVGQVVELSKTPTISETEAPGWISAEHFLIEGARGIVREVEADGKGFRFMVTFENESWINAQKQEIRVYASARRLFMFREDCLREES